MPSSLDHAKTAVSGHLALWAAFLLVHLWLGQLNLHGPGWPLGDVEGVYKFWVERFLVTGTIVGIDSAWVYPIVAFVPMLLSYVLGGAVYSATWISMVTILNAVALGTLTGWGRSRLTIAAGWWWVAYLLALGPIALGRIDSITVPIAIVGLVILGRHPRAAGVVLALATWMKVWPAALIAAIVVASRQRWQVVAGVGLATAGVVLVSLLLGAGPNLLSFITQQSSRGLQVEAPVSTPFLWMTAAGAPGSSVYYAEDILTFQVSGQGTEVAAAVMTPLLAIVALAIAGLGVLAVRRGVSTTRLLAPLALALVAAFIVVNKVGSPQFESWIAAPVALGIVLAGRGGPSFRVPAALTIVIGALTQLIYPALYGYLISVNPAMLVAITCRNLLLIALLAWAVTEVVRLARSSTVADVESDLDAQVGGAYADSAYDDNADEHGPRAWPLARD